MAAACRIRRTRLSPASYLVLLALAAILLAVPAEAHRLKVFANAVGGDIEGKAYFVGGTGAGDVAVELHDANTVLATTRTAHDGTFSVTAPYRADLTVVVDTMEGHRATFPIRATRLPEALPDGPGGESAAAPDPQPANVAQTAPPVADRAAIETAVARQIAPLAAEIDALRSALRLQDILGGLGYVVGIFGLFAFLKARRGKTPR